MHARSREKRCTYENGTGVPSYTFFLALTQNIFLEGSQLAPFPPQEMRRYVDRAEAKRRRDLSLPSLAQRMNVESERKDRPEGEKCLASPSYPPFFLFPLFPAIPMETLKAMMRRGRGGGKGAFAQINSHDSSLPTQLRYSVSFFFSFFVRRKHPPQAPPVREPQGPPVPAAGAEARPRAAAGDHQEQHRAAEAQRRRRQGRRVPAQEEVQGGLPRGRPGQAGAAAGAAAAVRGGAAAAAAGHPSGHAAPAGGGRRSRHAGEGQSQEVDGPTGKDEKLQFPIFVSLFNHLFYCIGVRLCPFDPRLRRVRGRLRAAGDRRRRADAPPTGDTHVINADQAGAGAKDLQGGRGNAGAAEPGEGRGIAK